MYRGAAHTDDMAVVLISERPCAVDVEHEDRDLSTHAPRFISASARALPAAGDKLFPIAIWCAKEVMYKIECERELSFLDDFLITEADLENGKIKGITKGVIEREVSLLRHGGYILAYIL